VTSTNLRTIPNILFVQVQKSRIERIGSNDMPFSHGQNFLEIHINNNHLKTLPDIFKHFLTRILRKVGMIEN
jgi:F0F1-type ATP synthase delta subunit